VTPTAPQHLDVEALKGGKLQYPGGDVGPESHDTKLCHVTISATTTVH